VNSSAIIFNFKILVYLLRKRTNLVPKKLICFYDISTGCAEIFIGIFRVILAEKVANMGLQLKKMEIIFID